MYCISLGKLRQSPKISTRDLFSVGCIEGGERS